MSIRRRNAAVTWVAALVIALVGVSAPAQADADADNPTMRIASTNVCVLPDFAEVGSGWRVHAAVRNWNLAQSVVVFTVGHMDECATVRVHRYNAEDGWGGYTSWENWGEVTVVNGVFHYTSVDVYLNDFYNHDPKWASKTIVAHELGHAIGLPHSFTTRSIMSYSYNAYRMRGQVGPADVRAVYALFRL